MLDIRLLNYDQEKKNLPFQEELDLREVNWWGSHPFLDPVLVTGTLMEERENYRLDYKVEYTSVLPCARCLTQVERKFSPSFSHLLGETKDDSPIEADDFVSISRGKINLIDSVLSDVLPDLEEAPLCREDCRGLCPVCGGNRNQTSCDCQTEEFKDPRWGALRELLGE